MSRILHRPMFRKGGSTSGITSGLRPGYKRGGALERAQSQLDLIDKLAPAYGGAGSDFLMNFGLNMVSNPPTGNIFQTAATQAKEPLQQFQKAKMMERAGRRNLVSSIIEGLSGDEKIALQEKIDYLISEHGLSKPEALARAMREHRLPMNPADVKRQEYENFITGLDNEAFPGTSKTTLGPILFDLSKQKAGGEGKYPQEVVEQWDEQVMFMPYNSLESVVEGQPRSEEGSISVYDVKKGYESQFADGMYYLDPNSVGGTPRFYRFNGNTNQFELYEITDIEDLKE